MKKYSVRVNILKSNATGTIKSEDFEYTFQEPSLIESRNNAISKVKELQELFNYGMPEGGKFSSPLEAELKGFKDFNAYSIDLYFIVDEDYDYQIYGEEELTIEALEQEAYHYAQEGNVEFTEIEDLEGEYVEVLESDLEFLLN
ncbi:hypothetical protein SAMN06265371_101290 [Lutibacter agarilyticus]|uniref:Uncharacterized protein n=1 Tax=Lutibacter agarilyticus TaxID=1109740 RepID=A0A238VGF7_9FLAO|nr:hypothetical protein [Lutibacter agarilyticus]SNR32599.1 hypothetical protein SAMN06265371_101290 [Lutibacter agarilyticus]